MLAQGLQKVHVFDEARSSTTSSRWHWDGGTEHVHGARVVRCAAHGQAMLLRTYIMYLKPHAKVPHTLFCGMTVPIIENMNVPAIRLIARGKDDRSRRMRFHATFSAWSPPAFAAAAFPDQLGETLNLGALLAGTSLLVLVLGADIDVTSPGFSCPGSTCFLPLPPAETCPASQCGLHRAIIAKTLPT